jgi:hypothetical protein
MDKKLKFMELPGNGMGIAIQCLHALLLDDKSSRSLGLKARMEVI